MLLSADENSVSGNTLKGQEVMFFSEVKWNTYKLYKIVFFTAIA